MARSATFRGVTGDIEKITFFLALWTDMGRSGRCDGVAAVVALPVGQAAFWTHIPDKFTFRGETTQGTLHFSLFLLHLLASFFELLA